MLTTQLVLVVTTNIIESLRIIGYSVIKKISQEVKTREGGLWQTFKNNYSENESVSYIGQSH